MRTLCAWLTQLSLSSVLLLALTPAGRAQTADQPVYTDSLQSGWQDYGWATLNYANTNPTHTGADSISVTAAGYQALYLHHAAQDSSPYASLTFWINGGAGGQKLQVQATLGGAAQTAVALGPLAANTWQKVVIGLDKLGVADNTNFDGFWIQDTTGTSQPTYYVDDVAVNAGTITYPPNAPVTVSVDAGANRHAISPLVYGVAFASAAQLQDLNSPLNRWGGNATTRYNWQTNATNHASDYFFESLPGSSTTPGGDADAFIGNSLSGGAQPMITVPTIGWVAKLAPGGGGLASFSVAKYGAQQQTDPYWADAGNGVKTDGVTFVTGNDPNDANQAADVNFQGGWFQHLLTKWGTAASGGVRYYLMDNEPSIWFGTHRDVHPVGPTMDEIKNDFLAYGGRVKAADPTALVVGPEEWGWLGYFYSGADQQAGPSLNYNPANYPDRQAHGGMDYIPYLLQQMQQHDAATGQRLLDVLSVHIYPQGGDGGNDTSPGIEMLRNRSTRSLWDPNYTDESWINSRIQLIPRLKGWVNTYYPGTKTAITEYNWGAEASISGATAQADIFGIFGREGLDLATRWTTPDPSTPTYKAMKLYRNYDGKLSAFGDTSVSDAVPNPDNLSSFAAVRTSDGALTVVVISKYLQGATPLTLNVANYAAGPTAQVWQLTGSNAISRLADTAVTSGVLTATLPAQSVTLFVIPVAQNTTIAADVSLQGVQPGSLAQPLVCTLTPTGTTAGGVTTQTITPAAGDGSFTLSGVPAGTYTLGVKGGKWLRRDVPIDTTGGSVTGLSVSLLGGDVSGHNQVSLADLAALRAAYGSHGPSGSNPASANWNPQADLTCDGQVSLADLAILRSNYGKAGDR